VLLRCAGLGKAYPRHSDPRSRLRAWARLLAGRPIERAPVLANV